MNSQGTEQRHAADGGRVPPGETERVGQRDAEASPRSEPAVPMSRAVLERWRMLASAVRNHPNKSTFVVVEVLL